MQRALRNAIGLLFALLPAVLGLTSRERLTARLQSNSPILETYWESYTSLPYNYSTCYTHTQPMEVDYSDFGVDLSTVPIAGDQFGNGVNVVNIAFASTDSDM